MLGVMFEPEAFLADCLAALRDPQPMLAVKVIVDQAVADPGAMASALRAELGVALLHRSPELTIGTVVVPPGAPKTLPHDHRMWAVVGVYEGQEDNVFFRRVDGALAESGGRSVRAGEALAMGDETIHAIENPLGHGALAAIHVYGGDLVETARSMWTMPGYDEQPYDEMSVLGARIRR